MGRLSVKGLQNLCLSRVISCEEYWKFKKMKKQQNFRSEYEKKPFDFSNFSNSECLLWFRFTSQEILILNESLKIPKLCQLSNRIRFSGLEGLCILLRRLSYPNRLCDLVKTFNRDESTLSRIINYMVKIVYMMHSKRLSTLQQPYLTRQKFQELADNTAESGCPYPNIVGFIDGTARPICRPKYNQRDMYSGYKKHHVLKYQSIVLTNGLIGRLDGPIIGRRHDAAILQISGVLEEMETVFNNNDGTWYAVYGDPGYSNQKFVKVGYKNHAKLNDRQKEFNANMSALRVGVEYGFGKILQQFAFLDFSKNQKLYMQPLRNITLLLLS